MKKNWWVTQILPLSNTTKNIFIEIGIWLILFIGYQFLKPKSIYISFNSYKKNIECKVGTHTIKILPHYTREERYSASFTFFIDNKEPITISDCWYSYDMFMNDDLIEFSWGQKDWDLKWDLVFTINQYGLYEIQKSFYISSKDGNIHKL